MPKDKELREFVLPYYQDKDIMHDLTHIERVFKSVDKLGAQYLGQFDPEIVKFAAYFHGFIYKEEDRILNWLLDQGIPAEKARKIITVAWESQKSEEPETLEGKILHDAHMIEGGKNYLVVKSLITGSVRGQTLEETISYIEANIIDQGRCYLPEAQAVYQVQQSFAKEFIRDLKEGLQ